MWDADAGDDYRTVEARMKENLNSVISRTAQQYKHLFLSFNSPRSCAMHVAKE